VLRPFFATERRELKETRGCFTCGEIGRMKWNCPTCGIGRGYNRWLDAEMDTQETHKVKGHT
jgi:hypothetical protein